mmetsp:Transcript_88215/g.284933  ORF Transcript_88215/g.284933 Transcript_88215/m.284933 type:complete len:189 (+) Transcript_88215:268-834(+)
MDQEHEEQCRPKEQEEERARQKREAQLRREREEEGEEAEDPHRQKEQRECEERLRLEEQVRAAEEVAEEAAQGAFAEKAARRAEALRAEQNRKRRAAVAAFLTMHGFTGGVSGAKRNLMNSTYPLHRAAKTANAQMVEYLLMEGADPTQANSAGRNAAQVAQRHDSKCSHAAVLRILSTSNARLVGGA